MSLLMCLQEATIVQIQNRIRENRFHVLFVKTGRFTSPVFTIYVYNKAIKKVVGVMTLDYAVADSFSSFRKRFVEDGWDKKSDMSKAAFVANYMSWRNRNICALGIRDFMVFKKPLSLQEFNERYNMHVKRVPAFFSYLDD